MASAPSRAIPAFPAFKAAFESDLKIGNMSDRALKTLSLHLVLRDGESKRAFRLVDRRPCFAHLLIQNEERIAIRHLLRGACSAPPYQEKKGFEHGRLYLEHCSQINL